MTPTIEDTPTIQLGGETYTMRFGVRALKELGINPFKPAPSHGDGEHKSQVAAFLEDMTIDKAAAIVRACILHEFGKRGPRAGQKPPTVEDIIDDLDLAFFDGKLAEVLVASGMAGNPPNGSNGYHHNPDPQTAWTGSKSGPLQDTTSDSLTTTSGS